ncbi:MAG: acyl-CoA dehydrogenase family protein [Myxococcota bacterium]
MDLSLDENQSAIREAIQGYVRSEVMPYAEAWDGEKSLERSRMQGLAELGMLGVMVDEAHDGVGLGLLDAALVLAQVGRGDGGLAVAMANHAAVAAPHIQRFGDEAQIAAWLPRLATGEALASWALAESGGVTCDALETQATQTTEGWQLNGAKRLVAGGALADVFLVVARVDDGARTFLVPCDTDGLTLSEPAMLGLRAGGLVDLSLVDVVLPSGAVLNGGWSAASHALDCYRVTLGAIAYGMGARAIEAAASYALERRQFGQPIARFQAIQNRLADAEVGVQAGGALVERAASEYDAGMGIDGQAAKAYVHATRGAFDAADHAIQVHGGYGYVREYQVERMWRDARTLSAMAGTAATARDTIAESIYR